MAEPTALITQLIQRILNEKREPPVQAPESQSLQNLIPGIPSGDPRLNQSPLIEPPPITARRG